MVVVVVMMVDIWVHTEWGSGSNDITCRIDTKAEVVDSEEQEEVYVDLLVLAKRLQSNTPI